MKNVAQLPSPWASELAELVKLHERHPALARNSRVFISRTTYPDTPQLRELEEAVIVAGFELLNPYQAIIAAHEERSWQQIQRWLHQCDIFIALADCFEGRINEEVPSNLQDEACVWLESIGETRLKVEVRSICQWEFKHAYDDSLNDGRPALLVFTTLMKGGQILPRPDAENRDDIRVTAQPEATCCQRKFVQGLDHLASSSHGTWDLHLIHAVLKALLGLQQRRVRRLGHWLPHAFLQSWREFHDELTLVTGPQDREIVLVSCSERRLLAPCREIARFLPAHRYETVTLDLPTTSAEAIRHADIEVRQIGHAIRRLWLASNALNALAVETKVALDEVTQRLEKLLEPSWPNDPKLKAVKATDLPLGIPAEGLPTELVSLIDQQILALQKPFVEDSNLEKALSSAANKNSAKAKLAALIARWANWKRKNPPTELKTATDHCACKWSLDSLSQAVHSAEKMLASIEMPDLGQTSPKNQTAFLHLNLLANHVTKIGNGDHPVSVSRLLELSTLLSAMSDEHVSRELNEHLDWLDGLLVSETQLRSLENHLRTMTELIRPIPQRLLTLLPWLASASALQKTTKAKWVLCLVGDINIGKTLSPECTNCNYTQQATEADPLPLLSRRVAKQLCSTEPKNFIIIEDEERWTRPIGEEKQVASDRSDEEVWEGILQNAARVGNILSRVPRSSMPEEALRIFLSLLRLKQRERHATMETSAARVLVPPLAGIGFLLSAAMLFGTMVLPLPSLEFGHYCVLGVAILVLAVGVYLIVRAIADQKN